MKQAVQAIALVLVGLLAAPALAEPPKDFGAGKKAAAKLWWDIGPASFYCHCPYREATAEEKKIRRGNLWVVGFACGYQAQEPITSKGKVNARPLRIEWEHIVPADWIATGFNCRDKKREECRTIPGYDEAEGDLFNLVPAVGELNGDRSNKLYGIIAGEDREYGACDFEVTGSKAEPMKSVRGDIARVWLYMIDQYGLKMAPDYVALMKQWSAADPVGKIEKLRHEKIAKEMGRENKFVTGQ